MPPKRKPGLIPLPLPPPKKQAIDLHRGVQHHIPDVQDRWCNGEYCVDKKKRNHAFWRDFDNCGEYRCDYCVSVYVDGTPVHPEDLNSSFIPLRFASLPDIRPVGFAWKDQGPHLVYIYSVGTHSRTISVAAPTATMIFIYEGTLQFDYPVMDDEPITPSGKIRGKAIGKREVDV